MATLKKNDSLGAVISHRAYFVLVLFCVCIVLFSDRLTKWKAPAWRGEFLSYTTNSGAAFGLFDGMPLLLGGVSVLLLGFLLYLIGTSERTALLAVGYGLMLGGALGNVYDRLSQGFVVDFIKLPYWPTFNIADSALTVGTLLICLLFMKKK